MLVVYHGGDYKLYIRSGVHLAAVFLIVSYELRKKDNCLIEVTAWFLNILLAVNLVLLILKPEGISSLLTYSEDMAFYEAILKKEEKKRDTGLYYKLTEKQAI